MYPLPFGTIYINNKLQVGVEPIQYILIKDPEHRIIYLDNQTHMCF